MPEEVINQLNAEVARHFRLLKKTTIWALGVALSFLVPMVGLVWSMNVSIIHLEEKTKELDLNKMNQTEVYDNFVNKGQYIYLEGERMKAIQDVQDGVSMSRVMTEWGKQAKDALDIRYRGAEHETMKR